MKYKRQTANAIQSNDAAKNNLDPNDYRIPCGATPYPQITGTDISLCDKNFHLIMDLMKPGCVGDESADFRRMKLGLIGDNKTECSFCIDVLRENHKIVTLPCFHVFHDECIMLSVNSGSSTCPDCQMDLPNDLSTYRVDADEQVQKRIDEYPISGYCEKCQIWIMERNRNIELGISLL